MKAKKLVALLILLVASLLTFGLAQAARAQLQNDNGTPDVASADFAQDDVVGSVLEAAPDQYPLRIEEVNFLLTRLPDWDASVAMQARVYAMDGAGGVPGTLLGASPAMTLTLPVPLARRWFTFTLASQDIVIPRGPFLVAVAYQSGTVGRTPSTINDSTDSIPVGKNYYSEDDGSFWREHYDWWDFPQTAGFNMVRAVVETNVPMPEIRPQWRFILVLRNFDPNRPAAP
jgi:hypothetical protein